MDSELLGHLLDRYAAALALFARQWCRSPEDVVQEAFVALARQASTPKDPAAWLFRTVRNGAINVGKATRRRERHERNSTRRLPWFDTHSSAQVQPEDVEDALRGLGNSQREVIIAHLWGNLRFDQIGPIMGISSSSAHRLYHAGLSILRERLGVVCTNKKTHSTNP